jgi:hypothetical protein
VNVFIARSGSVFNPRRTVRSVAVLIVEVVDVATVLDLRVSAVLAVLMRSVLAVLGMGAAFRTHASACRAGGGHGHQRPQG